MLYLVFLTFGLSVFWLLMSGYWDNPLLLFFGLLSVILCVFIAWRIEKKFPFSNEVSLLPGLPLYWFWLFKEVALANMDVLKRIWLPGKYPLAPAIRTMHMSQKSRLGKTAYANSITLTPGTITMDVDGDKITVYALNKDSLDELEKGEMDKRVTQLEKKIL